MAFVMKKKPKRRVRVDNGYGPASNYEIVTVLDSRQVNHLFDEGTSEELLVENCFGERYWVAYWDELPPELEDKRDCLDNK